MVIVSLGTNVFAGAHSETVVTLPITDSTTITAADFVELSSGKLIKSITDLSSSLVGVANTTRTMGVIATVGTQQYMGVITEGLVKVRGLVHGSGGTYKTALAIGSKVTFHYDSTADYGQFVVNSDLGAVGTVIEGAVSASGGTDDNWDYVLIQLDFESAGGGVNAIIPSTITGAKTFSGTITASNSTTGIDFSGTMVTAISGDSVTIVPNAAKSNAFITFGDRASAKEVDLASVGGTASNFEPIQMSVDIKDANGLLNTTSTVNMIYMLINHDTLDLADLRLKCSDWNVVVGENVKDVYVSQAEIRFNASGITVGTEVAVLGLVLDAGSDAVTNSSWRGINVTLRGSGTPTNSQGIFIHAQSGATVDDGIRIISSGTMRHAIRIGEPEYDDTPTHLFAFPAEGTSPISDTTNVVFGTDPVRISVLVGGAQYYMLAAKTFS